MFMMELFDMKDGELKKVNMEGKSADSRALSENELEELRGGYEMVSDPIYILTDGEVKALNREGYTLKKTKSGNYRVMDDSGKTVDPSKVERLCKDANNSFSESRFCWLFAF